MNNQLNTVNIFDVAEIEKQIRISESAVRCLDDAIKDTKTRLNKLLEKKKELLNVRSSIIDFNEVLKVL